jgi:ABC-type multidrug transport system fused ATPase/permease subunit
VGYVPQQVTLFDGSMGYNIALDPQYRNSTDRVREAARAASIDGFIESLPGGYEASVGEGGGRMSGGQRQRMGIARALYKGPELLLFDEATSAVDAITEEDIMRSIREISGRCTVVFVTHRLRSIQRCGSIIVLDEGRVVGAGTHESLLAGCPVYRALYAGDDEGHVPGRAAAGVPDSGPRRSAAGLPPDLPGAGFGRTT